MLRLAGSLFAITCCVAIAAFLNDLISTFGKDAIAPFVTAVGVASAAFISVWAQHKADLRELVARQRKARAVRAVMPGALAEIQSYLKKCVSIAISHYPPMDGEFYPREAYAAPSFPDGALKIFRDFIEHSDMETGDFVARIIRMLQIQNSRFGRDREESFSKNEIFVTQHDADNLLIDAVVIYAFVDRVYDYSRQRTDESPKLPDQQQLRSVANIVGIYTEAYEYVHRKLYPVAQKFGL